MRSALEGTGRRVVVDPRPRSLVRSTLVRLADRDADMGGSLTRTSRAHCSLTNNLIHRIIGPWGVVDQPADPGGCSFWPFMLWAGFSSTAGR